jgi:uncharacterized Zn finger protein (UPF0148 family)
LTALRGAVWQPADQEEMMLLFICDLCGFPALHLYWKNGRYVCARCVVTQNGEEEER